MPRGREGDPDAATRMTALARDRIGKSGRLDHAIVGGEGRVRIGDTVWRVLGDDAPRGQMVTIVRLDGTALVAEVRRRLARPDLPALITSGYANVALHDSIAAAATAFLPKPYALRELSDRVAALVPAPEGVAPTQRVARW